MKPQNHFKIVVLEDSDFYNMLLTRQLENYTGAIAADKNCSFEIQSYTNVNDCIRNINYDTDIAFVDYYLSDNKNALDILKTIKQKCKNCRIIIISQVKNIRTSFQTLKEGASNFICKDRFALTESCLLVEDLVNERMEGGLT
ncbi:MAG: response regulator [Bacteroidia bacterium]